MQLYQRSAQSSPSFGTILTPRRKKAVSSQTSELEALEARLKATEERLKQAASGSPPGKSSTGRSSPRQRVPLGDTFTRESPTSPLAAEFRPPANDDRSSGWKQEGYAAPMPGALPPTPGASEGEFDSEYVLVEGRKSADIGEDGDIPPPQKN